MDSGPSPRLRQLTIQYKVFLCPNRLQGEIADGEWKCFPQRLRRAGYGASG